MPSGCSQLMDSIIRTISIVKPLPNLRYPTLNAIVNKPQPIQARPFGISYDWRPRIGLNNYSIINPIFVFNKEQEYTVKLTNNTGCINVDTILIRIFKEGDIYVPNAFTPNGDGANDYMYPILVGMIELRFFRIFSRWGELLYETRDHLKWWDGRYKNIPQAMDTYTWTAEAIDPDGRIIKRSGNFVLIR